MNITDIDNTNEIPDNIWEAIWEKQLALIEKYKDIEGMPTILDDIKTNIQTAKGQAVIKDFAWRVTEELTEADEAIYLFKSSDKIEWDGSQLKLHYIEEVTDALHFFVELAIIAGFKASDFTISQIPRKVNSYDVIYQLGLAMNTLKNKKWKQSQMLTDVPKFTTYIEATFENLIHLFYCQGLANDDIYQMYFKKNAVNNFRIKSKY